MTRAPRRPPDPCPVATDHTSRSRASQSWTSHEQRRSRPHSGARCRPAGGARAAAGTRTSGPAASTRHRARSSSCRCRRRPDREASARRHRRAGERAGCRAGRDSYDGPRARSSPRSSRHCNSRSRSWCRRSTRSASSTRTSSSSLSADDALHEIRVQGVQLELLKAQLMAFERTLDDLGRAIAPDAGIAAAPHRFAELARPDPASRPRRAGPPHG